MMGVAMAQLLFYVEVWKKEAPCVDQSVIPAGTHEDKRLQLVQSA